MSRELRAKDYRTLAQFRHRLRVFLRFSEDAARAAGLTPAHHQLLLAVKGFDGEGDPSTREIADMLQLKLHSTVELVDRAAAAGLLRRRPDGRDGRRQLLSLTPMGERKLADLSLIHREELRRVRAELATVLRELG